jgi:alkylation response protein AidB-like acyl-CoA dehydrogenase
MKLALDDEQTALQETLRHLLEKECPTSLVREMKQSATAMPSTLWRALAEFGVFGLGLPAALGGEGGDLFALGLFFQEAGRVLCPTLVYSTLALRLALERLAATDGRQRWLPGLASGELTGTTALWNPSDSGDLDTGLRADRVADSWRVTGSLDFVANADVADLVLLSAVGLRSDGSTRTMGFVVPAKHPGWTATRHRTMSGDNQCRVAADLLLDDEHCISDDAGLRERDGLWVSNAATALQCMEMVGGAQAVLARTVEQIKTRHQFNRPIASFQAAQHHVANMHIAIDGARLVAHQAIWLLGQDRLAQREVAIAKIKCNEAYKVVTLTAHQLHGGMGYLRETDLHLWSERAKTTELLGGSGDVQLSRLERALSLTDQDHNSEGPRQ